MKWLVMPSKSWRVSLSNKCLLENRMKHLHSQKYNRSDKSLDKKAQCNWCHEHLFPDAPWYNWEVIFHPVAHQFELFSWKIQARKKSRYKNRQLPVDFTNLFGPNQHTPLLWRKVHECCLGLIHHGNFRPIKAKVVVSHTKNEEKRAEVSLEIPIIF